MALSGEELEPEGEPMPCSHFEMSPWALPGSVVGRLQNQVRSGSVP